MTSLYNQLAGLSLFSGSSSLLTDFYGSIASIETSAVRKARAAFDAPATLAPWLDTPTPASTDRLAQVRAMRTIIDAQPDNRAGDNIDVQTSFTAYKALDRLQLLAEAAAKTSATASERTALQKAFQRGLADLQTFLGTAKSDDVTLAFDTVASSIKSIGFASDSGTRHVVTAPVTDARDGTIAGLTGTEVISISLAKYGFTDTLTVDLSTIPQPPTLDGVVEALNSRIASVPITDGAGNPQLDGSGNPIPRWQTRFSVSRIADGEWGLAYDVPASETVAMRQANGGDALTIITTQSAKDIAATGSVRRFDDPAGNLASNQLQGSLSAADKAATEAAKLAQQQAAKPKLPSGVELPKIDPTVNAALDIRAVATDANGNSYVVGATAGDFGSNLSSGAKDLYLTKLDSQGKVIWQRSLGIDNEVEGAAISVAANGAVTIAGTVTGRVGAPTGIAPGTDKDVFVTRFSATGDQEIFATIPSLGDETASAIVVDASGDIYLGGRAANGGSPFVLRLNATGQVQEQRDFTGSGNIVSLALDGSGALLALTRTDGQSTLHQLDTAALASDMASFALGAVNASALAVSSTGEIAVAGSTATAVAGAQVNGLTGGQDGFVTRISADLSAATTSYIGTADDDSIDSIAFMGTKIYVSGRTEGTLGATARGDVDGFVARVDAAAGTVEEINQFGTISQETGPVRLAVAQGGGGTALKALGLPSGELAPTASVKIASQVGLKTGDSFSVVVDGGKTIKIEIEANDTLDTLMKRMATKLSAVASVTTSSVDGKRALSIYVKSGHGLSLISGPTGSDALAKLGIKPGQIASAAIAQEGDPKVKPGGKFNLALSTALTLDTKANAEYALKMIKSAVSMTQSAYRSLYWDDSKAMLVNGNMSGGGDAYTQSRMAAYQAALTRLTS